MTEKHSFPHKLSVFICALSVLICVNLCPICAHLCSSVPTLAQSSKSVSYEVSISATIGEPKLTVFGWTSPLALVELKGQRVSELVVADQNGYFYFDRIFLPRANPNYPEICLSVVDRQSRLSSFPTCLPPLPTGPFEIKVGPVLLPPTLSLEQGEFLPGQQVKASGATFPNSKVKIFLANETFHLRGEKSRQFGGTGVPAAGGGKHLGGEFVKAVYAFSLPQYEIQSDEQGNFEFNLPAGRPASWKVFAAAEYQSSPSPKSNSLNFKVLGWWEWLWWQAKRGLLVILAFFKPNWWWLIIGAEIWLIAWLWKRRKASSKESQLQPLG